MLSHEIPWKFILQDLFEQEGCGMLLLDLLNKGITAAHVISVTKAHFDRYGVSDKFM